MSLSVIVSSSCYEDLIGFVETLILLAASSISAMERVTVISHFRKISGSELFPYHNY